MTYHYKHFVILLAATFVILSVNTHRAKVCFTPDEVFYYKASQSLDRVQNVFGPAYFSSHRFQKPPLFYLSIFFSYKFLGINWFAARAPSVLAGLLLLIVTFLLGRSMYGEQKGFFAAGILATTMLFFRCGRIALPEMMFVLFITGAFYFGFRAIKEGGEKLFYSMFLCMGIANLTKGPIGIILPTLTLVGFGMFYQKRHKAHISIPWFGGFLLVFALSLLWIIPGLVYYGKSFSSHIALTEIMNRLTEKTPVYSEGYFFYYAKKIFFYIPAIATRFMPWTFLAPFAIYLSRRKLTGKVYAPSRLFLISWIIAWFVFFTLLPEKREHYALSLLPALALGAVSCIDFDRPSMNTLMYKMLGGALALYLFASIVILPALAVDGTDRLLVKLRDSLEIDREAPVLVSWHLDPQEAELYIDKEVFKVEEEYFIHHERATKRLLSVLDHGKTSEKTVFFILLGMREFEDYLSPFQVYIENLIGQPLEFDILAEDKQWRKKIIFKKFPNTISQIDESLREKVLLIRVKRLS